CVVTCRRPFMGRPVPRQFMRSGWLDLATTVPATACHRISYAERYSRFMGLIPITPHPASPGEECCASFTTALCHYGILTKPRCGASRLFCAGSPAAPPQVLIRDALHMALMQQGTLTQAAVPPLCSVPLGGAIRKRLGHVMPVPAPLRLA